jgi:FeS assembly SUF system protein
METNSLELEGKIVETLKTIYDPEIPVNIYDLGLIYEVMADADGKVEIKMTLTAPNCPMVDQLVDEIHDKVTALPGVSDFMLNIVFDPPWNKSMMTEEAKLDLGLF